MQRSRSIALVFRRWTRAKPGRVTGVMTIAAALVILAGVLTPASISRAEAASGGRMWASPSGRHSACSRPRPCDLRSAVAAAKPGTTIWLLSGNYGQVMVSRARATAARVVTVRQAPGNHATFDRLRVAAPNLRWWGLRIETSMYLTPAATNTRIRQVHFAGAGLFIRSNNTVVTRSLFENGKSIDGIQIGRANGVTVRYSTIRNYNQDGTSGYHADCLQMFDAKNISIHHNVLSGCYNSEITVSRGSGRGIAHVRIESNFIRGCLEKTAMCRGGTGLDLREPTANYFVVRNNTFAKSAVRLGAIRRTIFDRNIIGYLSICEGSITNSIVQQASPKCQGAATDSSKGTRMSSVVFQNLRSVDLRPLVPSSAKIKPVGGTPAVTGYDGRALPVNVAGAVAG